MRSFSCCIPDRITSALFWFCDNITDRVRESTPIETYGLPLNQKTISKKFKSLGYQTSVIGKWHLGEHPKYHPQ
ncbi:MAG: sulfatase-like hydrolase/transferase [Ekhidna sp.]|nr:sulfatase-like hydrolase/transferase [Ekhidna sp.]